MRSLMTATLALASTVLVACGGATVDDSASSTSIAPLTREAATTSASASATSTSAAASSSSAPSTSGEGQQAAPVRDGQSEEISELPNADGAMTDLDRELIDGLKEHGLDVSEIEQQLIGAAHLVCADGSNPVRKAAIEAVAGQLIEQGRIDKSFEETVALIDSEARSAYC